MQIVIDIPEKEFGIEIADKFQDFFKRLEVETKEHMISGTNLLCGAYELETIQMLMQALANGTPLHKGYGRLITEPTEEETAETIGGNNDFAECIRDAVKAVSLCDSCVTKGCIFQSGIIRSHCDFYKTESE